MPRSFDAAIRFAPLVLAKPWGGGSQLRALGVSVPEAPPTGEVWLVSDVPGHSSRIVAGPGQGGTLEELLRQDGPAILGDAAAPGGRFPLLAKLLEVRGALSLQVHPDAEQARRNGDGPCGKFEAWSVLSASSGARVTIGFDRALEAEEVRALIDAHGLEDRLNTFSPADGDAYVISPGTVHAARGGLLLFEVQETADVTYRLYDWGTVGLDGKPRELHVDKALSVARLDPPSPRRPARPEVSTVAAGVRRTRIVPPGAGPFVYDMIELGAGAQHPIGGERLPAVVVVLEGSVRLATDGGRRPEPSSNELRAGEAALWPAAAPTASVAIASSGRARFALAVPARSRA